MHDTPPSTTTIHDLSAALGGECQVIDVREASEWESERIPGTRLAPLSALEHHVGDLDRKSPVFVVCRSGNRASRAAAQLVIMGWTDVRVVQGGLLAWRQAGLPVEVGAKNTWSLERQVRFTAGLLVSAGIVGSMLVHPWLGALSGAVGAGLMYSAASDSCAMGMILARAPWNRSPSQRECGTVAG